ncbi:hypothetical protein N9Y42_08785 [Mariniblastus sp.]|nr:hypothetical protein [Mariniblastus sp.]
MSKIRINLIFANQRMLHRVATQEMELKRGVETNQPIISVFQELHYDARLGFDAKSGMQVGTK